MNWKYYNHAAIPTCAPHEEPDLSSIENGQIWGKVPGEGMPLLARWTTDFDCPEQTNWWYVIKDTPFDISTLKAKRRYEIRKGQRYFEVRRLTNPMEYAEALCDVQIAAFSAYPKKYRPTVDRDAFIRSVRSWEKAGAYVYGAFFRETGQLCGYAHLSQQEKTLNFNLQKTDPAWEKYAVNAVLVDYILTDYARALADGCYICDGSRSIQHETAFQDYLEKYFGFRKAYCRLHIAYNPKVKWLILLLYRFRKLFRKLDHIGLVHKMNGIFMMQELINT